VAVFILPYTSSESFSDSNQAYYSSLQYALNTLFTEIFSNWSWVFMYS